MSSLKRALDLIKKSKNIVISTHINPDADGIGSQIALGLALRKLKKKVICVNEDPLPDRYKYLDSNGIVFSSNKYLKSKTKGPVDLLIVVDASSLDRIGQKMRSIATKAHALLFIDHHPCPRELLPLHYIDTSVAATGELIGNVIEALGQSLGPEYCLPLYTAILIDTSSFRYPNVSGDTHRLLGKLLDSGISHTDAYNKIYGTKSLSFIKLLGEVLSGAKLSKSKKVAWMSLEESLLKKYKIDPEGTHSIINHLLVLNGVQVACMFREIGKNKIKVSLRSTGEIDVGALAQALGGGGHNHASATIQEGSLKFVENKIINEIEILLKSF